MNFPKKIFFNNFAPDKLDERRSKLEIFLNKVSELINLKDYPDARDFLALHDQTRVLLSSLEFDDNPDDNSSPLNKDKEDELIKALYNRKEGKHIIDFLKKLNYEPLKVTKSVQDFDSLYFINSLSFLENDIKCLLWGTIKLSGLLHFCGLTDNYVVANTCMRLLAKFLKYEYNSEIGRAHV